MRISDWSSDVCSSDLAPARADHRGVGPRDLRALARRPQGPRRGDTQGLSASDASAREEAIGLAARSVAVARVLLDEHFLQLLEVREGGVVVGAPTFGRLAREIGRASCRERVCQYV